MPGLAADTRSRQIHKCHGSSAGQRVRKHPDIDFDDKIVLARGMRQDFDSAPLGSEFQGRGDLLGFGSKQSGELAEEFLKSGGYAHRWGFQEPAKSVFLYSSSKRSSRFEVHGFGPSGRVAKKWML